MHAISADVIVTLDNGKHLCSCLEHLVCNDKADVSAAYNDHALAGEHAVDICHGLRSAGEHYAGQS